MVEKQTEEDICVMVTTARPLLSLQSTAGVTVLATEGVVL